MLFSLADMSDAAKGRTGRHDCSLLNAAIHCRGPESRHMPRRRAMSELDERYERGQETRRMFGGGQITGGSSPGAWDIAPDLERILGEARSAPSGGGPR